MAETDACVFIFHFGEPPSSTLFPYTTLFRSHGKGLKRTCKVGSYKPNRLGLYDMHGNVWQWCDDRLAPEASTRVVRGGGWCDAGFYCRASSRGELKPSFSAGYLGFRLAAVRPGEQGGREGAPP